ncbi:MAG TPA: 6,7-dimethyl-8-ribityllumazine synthase [bacterium]|nr:6,7-dimethyl-8-ribityllumazine synthase [bacterium]
MVKVLSDTPTPTPGRRIGIAVARFNEMVTERLLDGAMAALREQGVADGDIVVSWVPGAFELPLACRLLAEAGCEAVVMLGAIVRGGTDHYEYVCRGVTDGAMRVQLDLGVPVGFGVLTCAELEQALARAGGADGNKGQDAAMAALAMLHVRRQLAEEDEG